jgi:hypothetical protein
MQQPRPAPARANWGLTALIIALVAVAAIAILSRPRPLSAFLAAKRTEEARMKLPAVPSYIVLRPGQPIELDGVLDEPAWGRIKPIAFILHDASRAPRVKTEAKLCWDDKYLYLAFRCEDQDILSTYTKRDDPLYDQDVVEIFINPSGDLMNYYELEVSPRNVIWDGKIYNPEGAAVESTKYDSKWNCKGLKTAVHLEGALDAERASGKPWSVEMAIPFASIAKTPREGEVWRANLYRIDRGQPDEYYCWSQTQPRGATPSFHVPARFGRLVFSKKAA